MAPIEAADSTWEELRPLAAEGAVALLPVGSTEAHGPHLPLNTDVIIAEEVCRRSQALLRERGRPSVIFPALAYGVTDFAAGFTGTVTVTAATLEALLGDIVRSLSSQGFGPVVLVNHHLEPAHFEALHRVAASMPEQVVVPDHRRRPWALALGEEFCRGGSHAGSYETSLLLAAAPESVRELRRDLPVLQVNLGKAIRDGARTFEELGGERAYFGDPAAGSVAEGNALYRVLAEMVVELVEERAAKE